MNSLEYLSKYLGEPRSRYILDYLREQGCAFHLTKPRVSKRGDFRIKGNSLSISVNRDPNPYRFIITLVHELAHLKTYKEYGNKVSPPGAEWKRNHSALFRVLKLEPIFTKDAELKWVFDRETRRPKACSGVDVKLERVLSKYDPHTKEVFLADLAVGTVFNFRAQVYRKLETRRTRVLCLHLANGQKYTINKASKVEIVQTQQDYS